MIKDLPEGKQTDLSHTKFFNWQKPQKRTRFQPRTKKALESGSAFSPARFARQIPFPV
jgi:hypothetical protein